MSADAYFRRGNELLGQGRSADALASYDQAIGLEPAHVAALANRGEALFALGRGEEAIASYARALALRDDRPELFYNHGTILLALRRYAEALGSFDRSLALDAGNADALYNRGNTLAELGRTVEALGSYDQALALHPDDAATLFNRGNALAALQRPADAVASYDRALALLPGNVEILYNRANALARTGEVARALADYDRVLATAPDRVDALNNRGTLLWQAGRIAEAAATFEALAARAPDFDFAAGNLMGCRLRCCDWTDLPRQTQDIVDAVARGERVVDPFTLLALSDSEPAQLQCARIYAAHVYPSLPDASAGVRPARHERIRIAYLSADFHGHATSFLAARLFERHDRGRFEVHAISFGPGASDAMRARLRDAFERFEDVSAMTDRDVAALLRGRGIDIAVDLKGYTTNARTGIFAQRAAPVQVSFLGYPATMGASYIDYLIADERVVPPGHDAFYTERVVRLPVSYQVNDGTRPIAGRVPARAEAGLPASGFVFACFNTSWKITPRFFSIWMRLLATVPGSVLWLLSDNADATRNLRREAQRQGVAPDRLVFAPRVAPAEHLARHRLADLFLDTLPCNAHTTASDALWAGLPVLTCVGGAFAGRVAASLLEAANLPELVTHDADAYEALARRLALEPGPLSALRARLAQGRASCALFDTDRFRRHLEAAYTVMAERYRRGEPPAALSIPPG